jgi:thiol:disulfide interchange protein DsbD
MPGTGWNGDFTSQKVIHGAIDQQGLSGMLLLQADVTANSEADRQLLQRFSLFGPPGIVFFDASGREIKGLRVIGYQNAERFLKTLERAASS